MRIWCFVCVTICLASLQLGVRGSSDGTLAAFLQEAEHAQDWMVSLRRELHQWPELMYQEHNTSLFLRKVLDDLKIPYRCAKLRVHALQVQKQCSAVAIN